MNKSHPLINTVINPEVFIYAAELMLTDCEWGNCGSCKALAQANSNIEGHGWSYLSAHHKFFIYFFPWTGDLFRPSENVERVDFGPYWDKDFNTQEHKEHRTQALLLCAEMAKSNNRRLIKNEKRRNKKHD